MYNGVNPRKVSRIGVLVLFLFGVGMGGCGTASPTRTPMAWFSGWPTATSPAVTQTPIPFALRGEYLGQPRPGLTPEPFAPEVLSVEGRLGYHLHTSLHFSPDGQEVYFTHQTQEPLKLTILVMRQEAGTWTDPQVAPFSGIYDDNCEMLSSDGRRLYFTSNRPTSGTGESEEELGIWFVERRESGWSEPRHLRSPTDLDRDEGPLYFSAILEGGQGDHDVYRCRFVEGHYTEPENLGTPLNTSVSDTVVLSAPDESFLILYRFSPTDKAVRGLHLSFRNPDDSWTETIPLDRGLGLQRLGFDASLSPDGKYLFLLDRGVGIYWVDTSVLGQLKAQGE